MNYRVLKIGPLFLFLLLSFQGKTVVMLSPIPQDTFQVEYQNNTVARVHDKVISKKESRLKKRLDRLKKRILKKNNSFGDIFSSPKFRLGALLFLIGVAAAVVVNILTLAQIFGWLAGIVALVGVIYMVWGLIEYS